MPTKDKPIWNTALINNGKLEQAYELAVVRHGHWIITPYGHMTCSSCEWLFEYYGGLEEEWNYCPHCGAKMDEVEK